MEMSHEHCDVYHIQGHKKSSSLGLRLSVSVKLLSLGYFNLGCNEFTQNQKQGADATFASQIFPMASMHDWLLLLQIQETPTKNRVFSISFFGGSFAAWQ